LSIARNIRSVLIRTKFIVNGSLEVALASAADGVHLQRENIPVRSVRSKYRTLIIGYSAHDYEEMKDAANQGASYLFISPVFQPKSNSKAAPLGPATVSSWANSMEVPVFALGGITHANQNELIDSGCRSIAGISLFIQDGKFTAKRLVA
jgi:thiamine-phosphate diphosphorylase